MHDRLDLSIRRLSSDIPGVLLGARIPGLSVAVVRDATIAWVAAFGRACVQPARAVTTETVFQAASLSKPLFAYAVRALVESGKLDLDAPLTEYLNDRSAGDDPLLPAITARRVLCHMTGWPNWCPDGGRLVRERIPGAAFGYSGEGYLYLQAAVEQIVGKPLDVHMHEAVLDPLGMTASSYRWAAAGDDTVAAAHDRAGRPREPYVGGRPEASSSLHTTPADFARFLCTMLAPLKLPIHPDRRWVADLLKPHVQLTSAMAWGLGWGLEDTGSGTAFWHWGDNPGYKSMALAEPATGTGIVLMTNGDGGLGVCDHLIRTIIGGEHPALEWLAEAFYNVPTLAEIQEGTNESP